MACVSGCVQFQPLLFALDCTTPALVDQVLDVAIHGKDLRLHYHQYLNWRKVEHTNEGPVWSDKDDKDKDDKENKYWSENGKEHSERSQAERGQADYDTPLDNFFTCSLDESYRIPSEANFVAALDGL